MFGNRNICIDGYRFMFVSLTGSEIYDSRSGEGQFICCRNAFSIRTIFDSRI